MKSKISFCNVSTVLVVRNLKQFWLIPFAAFLAYFIKGVLPLIVRTSKNDTLRYETLRYLTDDALSNHDLVFLAVLMILPICASVAVFSYLHSNASATALHAMPFSRKKLYSSALASGLVMIALPILLTGLCYGILLRGNAYDLASEAVPFWIMRTLISAFFVYAVSAFAAVVAGSVVTHILLAMFFNGILPITIFIINRFLGVFLFGYTYSPLAGKVFSPVSFEWNNYLTFYNSSVVLTDLAYLVIALLLTWVSAAAYRRLPLEKEGNAVVHSCLGEVICVLFAFVASIILCAFFMQSVGKSQLLLVALIASFAFYTLARMILEKSFAVFCPAALKKYTAVLAALAIFFALTVFDLTGYTTRVPKASDITSVTLDDEWFDTDLPVHLAGGPVLKEKENLQNLREFHSLLADSQARLTEESTNAAASGSATISYFYIDYSLKGGGKLQRDYQIPLVAHPELIAAYKKVYESKEYKQQICDLIQAVKIADLQLWNKDGTKLIKTLPASFNSRFQAALIKDVKAMTFEDAIAARTMSTTDTGDVSFQYTLKYREQLAGKAEDADADFRVYQDLYPHVNALLKKAL